MQQELLSANSADTSSRSAAKNRCGVVALGLLAAGAGIGFLGSSSNGLLAESRSALSMYQRQDMPNVFKCHPWDGRTAKIFVSGYDSGSLNKWWSQNNDGHWMIARYDSWSDGAPLLFQAADHCGEYNLQNVDPAISMINGETDHWLSFTSSGQWVRSAYAESSAMPIEFIAQDDGTYKMKNAWAGNPSDLGGYGPNDLYFGYTASERTAGGTLHPTGSVRTNYNSASAMKVNLVWNEA